MNGDPFLDSLADELETAMAARLKRQLEAADPQPNDDPEDHDA